MAKIRAGAGSITIIEQGGDDVHTIKISRDRARGFFDGEEMGEDFNTALDLAQAAASEQDAVLIVIIKASVDE